MRDNHPSCGKCPHIPCDRNNLLLLKQLELATPFQLYFNPILILKQGQLWRLVTTFLFFGTFGFNFFFNMIFTYRYCRMLEEGSFRSRTADFVMMFLFGGTCMIVSFYQPAQQHFDVIFLNPHRFLHFLLIYYFWDKRLQ